MGDYSNNDVESKEMTETVGSQNHGLLYQTSRRGIFQGKVKPFEPSARLMEQLQREDISKNQSLEKIYSYPLDGFLNDFKSHGDDRMEAKDEKTFESSSIEIEKDSSRTKSNLNLEIQLDSIVFHEHYHFNEEERLAHSLCEQMKQFHDLIESGKKEYFISRLVALTKSIEECSNGCLHLDINITFDDVQNKLNEIASVEHEIHSGYMSIIQKWKDLKTLRTNQGFQSTTIMLEKEAIEDIDSLNDIKQSLTLLESKRSWLLQHLSRSSNDTAGHRDYREELMTLLWTGNVIVSTESTRYDIHIIKNDIKHLTNIALYPLEQKRRSLLQGEKYFVRFIVNGYVVLQTKVHEITWPSWTLKLNERVICNLSKFPDYINVQIFRRRFGLLSDEFISETALACPGKEISDDANQLKMLSETEASSTFTSNSKSRNVRGEVNYTMAWTMAEEYPNSSLDLALVGVPPLRAQRIVGQRHNKLSPNRRIQSSSCDSIEDLTFSLLSRYATAFRVPGTKHLYMNNGRVQESLRHYMIRQREYRHPGCNDEIPLLDSDLSVKDRNRLIAEKDRIMNYEEVSIWIVFTIFHGLSQSNSFILVHDSNSII